MECRIASLGKSFINADRKKVSLWIQGAKRVRREGGISQNLSRKRSRKKRGEEEQEEGEGEGEEEEV